MESHFWDNLLWLRKQYAATLEPVCRKWSLTRNELDVLLFLANNPAYDRAADIVLRRRIAKSHVSLAVQSLEQRGYLQGAPDSSDRRVIRLRLTGDVAEPLAEAQAAQQGFFQRLVSLLSPEEWQTLQDLTAKFREKLAEQEES